MFKFYLGNIKEVNEESIKDLSIYRINKALSFKNEKDKLLSLSAGIALNKALKEYNLKEKDLITDINEFGKPYFKDRNDIKFNLSHSFDTSICVISQNEIGVDIEKKRKYNEKLSLKYFSKEENDYINKSINKDESFTRIWTLKESFLKCIGQGLILNMNEISFLLNDNEIKIIQNIVNKKFEFNEFRIENYFISICEKIID